MGLQRRPSDRGESHTALDVNKDGESGADEVFSHLDILCQLLPEQCMK